MKNSRQFDFYITNCELVCSRLSLQDCIDYKFTCLSTYWQWKLGNECARISAVIVKILYWRQSWRWKDKLVKNSLLFYRGLYKSINVKCRLQTEGKMKTVDFLSELCYHFHHRELIINRLTGALFLSTWVVFCLTRVQTFTAMTLNNAVYRYHSIM